MDRIGRYQIEAELGRGAMGVVYKAVDPAIGRPVAIKTIRLDDIAEPEERARLQERLLLEARSAGQLSHPGIVTIYDAGEQGSVSYFAMEFVDGHTVEALLASGTEINRNQILDILRQTAAALDYAHKKGIVHRDIKPANIMIRTDGTVKITDFGVAKITASGQHTQAGIVLGTPNYMSPEQLRGKAITGAVDQFALAVVTYEILTGERPFAAEELPAVFLKIISEDPLPPSRLNPTLGPEVDQVIAKALSKQPEARFSTCTEFVQSLEKALARNPLWHGIARGASQEMPTLAPVDAPTVATPSKPRIELPPLPAPPAERPADRAGVGWGMILVILIVLATGIYWVVGTPAGRQWWASLPLSREASPSPAGSEPAPLPPAAPAPTGSAGTLPQPLEKLTQEIPPPSTAEPSPSLQPQPRAEPDSTGAIPEPALSPAPAPAGTKSTTIPAPPAVTAKPPRLVKPEAAGTASLQNVMVIVDPPGAQVMFDDRTTDICIAPCAAALEPGRHTVAVTLKGYRTAFRVFEVKDAPLELRITLQQPMGNLQVVSVPPDAFIVLNGRRREEKTPATLRLPVGTYRVGLEKEGFAAPEQTVEVRDEAYLRLDFQLSPR